MAPTKPPARDIGSAEVTRLVLPPCPHFEVREQQNGTWSVWYPDPAFIPCAPVCDLGKVMRTHKHVYEQDWIKTNYQPTNYEDAMQWAEYLAEGRDVKVFPFLTAAEKRVAASLEG